MSEHDHAKDPHAGAGEHNVFKSTGVSQHTINEFTNSAISNPAIDRSADEARSDEVYVGQEKPGAKSE
ncbi:MAG: hypothetical protein EBR51_02865, partial [Gammaproteobacteria bacterium]|nr:hypothetical protein [Gammaproteobacteria bacterium]